MEDSGKVYVRVRSLSDKEKERNCKTVISMENNITNLMHPKSGLTTSYIFSNSL